MAYSTDVDKQPYLVSPASGGANTFNVWHYKSADTIATVHTDGYITNAKELGMKALDVVIVVDTTTPAASIMTVAAINANGSADLTDGTAIVQTDTD